MQIIFSSKNMELTDGLKTFIRRKLQGLQKFSSTLGISNIFVNLDIDSRRKGAEKDAVVELVSDIKQKKIAVREQDETFFKAFFKAVRTLKSSFLKEKGKRVERPRR